MILVRLSPAYLQGELRLGWSAETETAPARHFIVAIWAKLQSEPPIRLPILDQTFTEIQIRRLTYMPFMLLILLTARLLFLAVFKVSFLEGTTCNVEIPPDSCLARGNGIVELRNRNYDMLVLWQPKDILIIAGFTRGIYRDFGRKLDDALRLCAQQMPRAVSASELDEFEGCVSYQLETNAPRRPQGLAVLPRSLQGDSASWGYVWFTHIDEPGFDLMIVMLPF